MNKLVAERDWSAQEVCHMLLNLKLQQGSHQVISVDVRPEHMHSDCYGFRAHDDGGDMALTTQENKAITLSARTFRFMAISAVFDLEMHQMDISNAYLFNWRNSPGGITSSERANPRWILKQIKRVHDA